MHISVYHTLQCHILCRSSKRWRRGERSTYINIFALKRKSIKLITTTMHGCSLSEIINTVRLSIMIIYNDRYYENLPIVIYKNIYFMYSYKGQLTWVSYIHENISLFFHILKSMLWQSRECAMCQKLLNIFSFSFFSDKEA